MRQAEAVLSNGRRERWADLGSRWVDQLPAFQAVSQTVSVLLPGLLCKYPAFPVAPCMQRTVLN